MKSIFLFISLLLTASCKAGPPQEKHDSFAFGTAYGFCKGSCATFYKIENAKLYPDNIDHYKGEVTFEKAPLADEKYQLAKNLPDSLPAFLLQNNGKTFGCPDCADQGGIHVFYTRNGQLMQWHFDTNTEALPSEIKDYISRMKDILNQL
jgi:hypothetical protein